MKRFKVLHKISFVLLGGLLLLGISIYAYVPSIIADVKNPVASLFNSELGSTHLPAFERYGIRKGETRMININDSIRLSLYIVPSETGETRGTVLALHGYRSSKNRFLPAARYFTRKGWQFIAVDLRAHNQSTGIQTGFSYYERYDISTLIDSLEKAGWIRSPLVLYGHSIGAATAVYVAAERPEVKALILESCFDDFRHLLPNYWDYYVTDQTDMPDEMAAHFFERAQIPLDSIRPLDVAPAIHIPILQIQGEEDQKVRPAQARHLFDAFGSTQKQWLEIPQGTHNRLWLPDTTAYFRNMTIFLDSSLLASPLQNQ